MARRKKPLTKLQEGVIKAIVKDPAITLDQAAKKAGSKAKDKKGLASTAAHVLGTKSVQQRMRELMDKDPKLRDEALLKKLKEGLEAKQTKFFAHEGEVVDEREVEDPGTRATYLDMALKVKGAMVNKTEVTGKDGKDLIGEVEILKGLSIEQLKAIVNAL